MPVSFPRPIGSQPQRPEMFEEWTKRFPAAHAGMATAIKSLVEGYKAYCLQYRKTNADETVTEAARLVRNAKAARAQIVPLVEALDVATDNAATRIAELRAKAAEAYNPPNPTYPTCMRHAEIRAHFKSLPNPARLKLVETAQKEGDEDTLVAIASCQPYLSGVVPQQHQYVRDQLIEKYRPNEAAGMKAIGEQRVHAEQLRQQMLESVGGLVNFARADELIAAAHEELAA